MFTGIITETGSVDHASRSKIIVMAKRNILRKLDRGASISVDGACLTVVSKGAGSFAADIMRETARRTILSRLQHGAKVNLELPTTPSSLLSGHIVQGHIDGIGRLKEMHTRGMDRILSFHIPKTLSRYIVEKGSIAVNGISLTVIKAIRLDFTVGIAPHTWNTTMLHELLLGDCVNVEVDVLAKYVEKFIKKYSV